MIMTDNDYERAIVWCKKKIENAKKYHILSGKRLEGYEEAMLCVMSYLHCEKERLADNRRAVEVVRCRECKFRSSWMMNRNLRYICPESGMFPNCENDFCSYGKPKGGENNA